MWFLRESISTSRFDKNELTGERYIIRGSETLRIPKEFGCKSLGMLIYTEDARELRKGIHIHVADFADSGKDRVYAV